MNKPKKTTNVILRVSDSEHDVIKMKSKLFNRKKSDYLRHAAFSYWEDLESTKHFKELLKIYTEGSGEEKKQVVELLFQYYRRSGFPHNVLTDEQKENRMSRIIKSKDILLEDNHLQQNHQGIDLANHYHPHMMEARYSGGDNSPMETYLSDDGLKDCINRWLELEKITNPAGMRRILKTRNGTRGVVNFKPCIAKFIYDNHCPENGKVLDPCSGYSGRLAGCIGSNRNIFYHGIDPNGESSIGNMEMANYFSTQTDMFNRRVYQYRFRQDMGMAEEVMPEIREEYNLVFTSPPYFNVEIYSDEETQSCNKYKEYESWLEQFLWVLVNESKRVLKEDGRLIINIKNIDKYKIADDLCKYCEKDWELEKTYHMRLANNEFNRNGVKMHHTEPIFVFRKKEYFIEESRNLIKSVELY
ncbi:MAG: hypothetical protein J7L15_04825 [Clostridiales bacterium]|nr:hypothetical protein [Clostridiales bacterium]